MSPTLKDPSFKQKGELTDKLVKEHTVPSCGIGAKDAIQKAGWDGNSASIAAGSPSAPQVNASSRRVHLVWAFTTTVGRSPATRFGEARRGTRSPST